MNILVTGGTGFIGSHLCQQLVSQGHHVICLDNNFTGSLSNVSHLRSHSNFEFLRHDVTEKILLEVDQIYHLACPASPKNYQSNAIKTVKTNVIGTLNMLGLAKRNGARILLSSTSEVYGDPKISPQPESYWGNVNPVGIRSCYDEGKRMAETLMTEYHRTHQVDIRIARIFNTYGPKLHHDDGRVVSNFITQALTNRDITIYGDGSQTRSFCFVDDLVQGLIALMNKPSSEDTHLPVNLGNPAEMSMLTLAQKIITLTNSQSKISYHPLPLDDPAVRKPDISRAKQLLDWTPKISLESGLKSTIEYFQNKTNNSSNTPQKEITLDNIDHTKNPTTANYYI